MDKILFKEVQRNGIALFVLLLLPLLIFVYGIYQQIIMGMPFGDKPASDTSLICITLFYALFLIFIYSLKLTTVISSTGIAVSYSPFFKDRFYSFDALKSIEVERYSPYLKYLGHGYRKGFDGSTAYTVKGDHAFILILEDGSKLRIGTQQPHDAKMALARVNNE